MKWQEIQRRKIEKRKKIKKARIKRKRGREEAGTARGREECKDERDEENEISRASRQE